MPGMDVKFVLRKPDISRGGERVAAPKGRQGQSVAALLVDGQVFTPQEAREAVAHKKDSPLGKTVLKALSKALNALGDQNQLALTTDKKGHVKTKGTKFLGMRFGSKAVGSVSSGMDVRGTFMQRLKDAAREVNVAAPAERGPALERFKKGLLKASQILGQAPGLTGEFKAVFKHAGINRALTTFMASTTESMQAGDISEQEVRSVKQLMIYTDQRAQIPEGFQVSRQVSDEDMVGDTGISRPEPGAGAAVIDLPSLDEAIALTAAEGLSEAGSAESAAPPSKGVSAARANSKRQFEAVYKRTASEMVTHQRCWAEASHETLQTKKEAALAALEGFRGAEPPSEADLKEMEASINQVFDKALDSLQESINVLERLVSEGGGDEDILRAVGREFEGDPEKQVALREAVASGDYKAVAEFVSELGGKQEKCKVVTKVFVGSGFDKRFSGLPEGGPKARLMGMFDVGKTHKGAKVLFTKGRLSVTDLKGTGLKAQLNRAFDAKMSAAYPETAFSTRLVDPRSGKGLTLTTSKLGVASGSYNTTSAEVPNFRKQVAVPEGGSAPASTVYRSGTTASFGISASFISALSPQEQQGFCAEIRSSISHVGEALNRSQDALLLELGYGEEDSQYMKDLLAKAERGVPLSKNESGNLAKFAKEITTLHRSVDMAIEIASDSDVGDGGELTMVRMGLVNMNKGDEAGMVKLERKMWGLLKGRELSVPGEGGAPAVKVRLNVIYTNWPINLTGLVKGGGQDSGNAGQLREMQQTLQTQMDALPEGGDSDAERAELRGLSDALQLYIDDPVGQRQSDLSAGDPNRIVSLLNQVAKKLGAKVMVHCKSGKDRTTDTAVQLTAENILERSASDIVEHGAELGETDESRVLSDQIYSASTDIQRDSTGRSGGKTEELLHEDRRLTVKRDKYVPGLSLRGIRKASSRRKVKAMKPRMQGAELSERTHTFHTALNKHVRAREVLQSALEPGGDLQSHSREDIESRLEAMDAQMQLLGDEFRADIGGEEAYHVDTRIGSKYGST
jgi:hypothetical protein